MTSTPAAPGAVDPLLRGDEAHEVLVVGSGVLKVAHTVEGHEVVLDALGELTAVDGGPRSTTATATATTLTPVDVTAIPTGAFMSYLGDHPDAGLALLQCIAGRLRDASRREVEYGLVRCIRAVDADLVAAAPGEGVRVG